MTIPTGEDRRAEARRLRVDPGLSLSQLMKHFGVGSDTLTDWLRGIEPPAWTRRPNAKDELRAQAVELRLQGCSVPKIAEQLGVSKSTAYLWVKHLPLDKTSEQAHERRSEHSRQVAEVRWEPLRRERDAQRAAANGFEATWVDVLSDREVRLMGAVAYWCEGRKAKPWRPNDCRVTFVNSDPVLILLFVRFAELMGKDRMKFSFTVSIHESADAEAAGRWWADVVEVPFRLFRKPTVKTHNPSTVRYNVGDAYRGCLVVEILRSRELYWKIEGLMSGIAAATDSMGEVTM